MSQINANFQEIMSNNSNNNNQSNTFDNVTGTAIITSETLQGFSMANQFAICANSGNGPVLLSCLTPMLLPTLTGTGKCNFELTGGDGRTQNQPQTVQIQLASPFNLAGNLCNTNNAQSLPSLGLSYINLSSLANAGTAFPLQITLNNLSNNNGSHQLTIPTATLNSLNHEVQIAHNYQIGSQVKFESECNVNTGQQQHVQIQQSNQQQQHTIVTRTQDISDIDDKVKRKPRRRIPNKSNKSLILNSENTLNNCQSNPQHTTNSDERLLDHKGRPFIYNCPNCPKKFTLNSRLTAHLRCHTGIRPYTCVQCGFSFTQKSYLIRHAAVHTEERPFTCERCLKTYKHYGSLANHRKLHRKEDKNGLGDGGCTTSEISADSDQKPEDSNGNHVSTTTVAMATTTAPSNYENIIQLHSDWSNVESHNNNNSTNTTTYLITNTASDNTASNNNIAYYASTESLSLSSSSGGGGGGGVIAAVANVNMATSHHVLSGTGSVAFPDQQLTDNSGNNSLALAVSNNQSILLGQGFCVSNSNGNNNSNQSAVFIDHNHLHRHQHHQLQLIPSSQSSTNNNHNTNIDTNNPVIFTHVELSSVGAGEQPQLSQSQLSTSSSSSQLQQTYSNTTYSTINTE